VQEAARAGLDGAGANASLQSGLPRLRIGVLLRHVNAISEQDLNLALVTQRESGCRLGAELIRLRRVAPEHVLRALAAQANVSYLTSFDLSRVKNGPSWLPAETVRALGVVPFDIHERDRRVRILCQAPVPRAAVRALQKLTSWTAEIYLVGDRLFADALAEYESEPSADAGVVTVGGLDDAAALVADSASADRAVTMRHAQWDRYTWVRVEGPTHVSDVLVPGEMEGSCLAAPTPH
jgi:hypothetical protein